MFVCCARFQSDLSEWNVSNVHHMKAMFFYCPAFDSDLSKWDVSNVNIPEDFSMEDLLTCWPGLEDEYEEN